VHAELPADLSSFRHVGLLSQPPPMPCFGAFAAWGYVPGQAPDPLAANLTDIGNFAMTNASDMISFFTNDGLFNDITCPTIWISALSLGQGYPWIERNFKASLSISTNYQSLWGLNSFLFVAAAIPNPIPTAPPFPIIAPEVSAQLDTGSGSPVVVLDDMNYPFIPFPPIGKSYLLTVYADVNYSDTTPGLHIVTTIEVNITLQNASDPRAILKYSNLPCVQFATTHYIASSAYSAFTVIAAAYAGVGFDSWRLLVVNSSVSDTMFGGTPSITLCFIDEQDRARLNSTSSLDSALLRSRFASSITSGSSALFGLTGEFALDTDHAPDAVSIVLLNNAVSFITPCRDGLWYLAGLLTDPPCTTSVPVASSSIMRSSSSGIMRSSSSSIMRSSSSSTADGGGGPPSSNTADGGSGGVMAAIMLAIGCAAAVMAA